MSLAEALARRRSVRRFSGAPLSMVQLSQLLWATQGVTAPGRRTAPSAGALYPLEVLLVALRVEGLAAGAYRFRPQGHVLQPADAPVTAPALQRAALGQQAVGTAAMVVALTAVASRSAGAAAQNLALQAVALALGSVVVGGFDDAAIAELLQLPADEQPLALLAIGALP
jgi:SagB-type dehydrogenase family enzyme